MYNRYIPGANGRYRCEQVHDTAQPESPSPETQSTPTVCQNTPQLPALAGTIDTGDLLVLAILALLLLDGEGDELLVLIAAIAFLFF